ncbi:cytochrome P450 9e2-like [Anoplolepis gracilipes]|uniref:cytochrome P450 9e2-like n=1 Tax=Anoplolepis gracilipes TaxID=354296 RepID=UPI003B9EA640
MRVRRLVCIEYIKRQLLVIPAVICAWSIYRHRIKAIGVNPLKRLLIMDIWILLSILAGSIAAYYYLFKNLNFFKKHGILHIPPWPVVGNMGPAFFRQLSIPELIQKIYNLNSDAKYVGFFDSTNPVVVIRDPDLIKSIAVKNFESFLDHRAFIDEANDPLFGKNLFSLRGEKWRDVRTLLSPAFTSSKMKAMFKLMSDCAANFTDFLSKLPFDKSVVELKDCFTKYTNDVIATCAFGINVDSMRNPNNEFYVNGKDATNLGTLRTIKIYFIRSMPVITKMLGIKFVSNYIGQFFKDLVRSTIDTRDKQNIVRPDMLQLMMESRGKRGPGKELTIEDMTAQAFSFFFGGFDTVSTLMCFAVHEITVNPSVQTKLRNEVDEVLKKTNGDLTYEALNGMQYLDAVVNEALRMWSVASVLDRVCTQDFELPPALPGDKPFVVRKGSSVWFPAHGLHRDAKYFEKPDEFYPERFLAENKDKLNTSAYLPFGIGPRMCIGNRFALLETKAMIFHLLTRCELKPCAKTSHPLQLSKGSFNMKPDGGFWVKIQARKDVHTSISTSVNGDASNAHI